MIMKNPLSPYTKPPSPDLFSRRRSISPRKPKIVQSFSSYSTSTQVQTKKGQSSLYLAQSLDVRLRLPFQRSR